MRGLSKAVTIGVLLLLAGGAVMYLRFRVVKQPIGQRFQTYAMFRDGSGLPVGSQVVIAGVQVGEIDGLAIQDGLARINMRLRNDVVIWDDAFAAKRASSLLGDSFIEILPGGPHDDAPADPARHRLVSGDRIPHVLEGGSTEQVLRGITNAMPRVDSAMIAAQRALLDGRRWVSGPFADGWQTADRWLETGAIAAPIDSAARGAAAFDEWTVDIAASTAGLSDRITPRIAALTENLADADGAIGSVEVRVRDGLGAARKRMDELDPYIARANAALAEYAGEVPEEQQGALARLINDDELGDSIDDTTAGAKGFTDGLNKTISFLGLRAEYNVLSGLPRVYVVAEINTRNDKFYLIEVEKGGLGGLPDTTLSDELGSDVWTLRSRIEEEIRFTLQWGKRFGPVRFRFGIKESSFGLGSDLELMNHRLRLSADVFESQFARPPRVKLAASLAIFRYIYVIAGVDDVLNPGGFIPIAPWPAGQDVPTTFQEVRYGRDYFVGGMINITDADLATMLRVYGALLIAGLAPAP